MQSSVELLLGGMVAVSAIAVVAFEGPVRSTVALVCALLGSAALMALLGQPLIGSLLVWSLGGGAGLLLLLTILLLDLRPEETGARRYSVRRTAAVLAVAWLGQGLWPAASHLEQGAALREDARQVAQVVFERNAMSVALLSLSLLAAMLAGLTIARRRG